ncbi:hypothetical protein E2C01_024074 [Portunus trituberculatus]|uniref:Uncharacterized protein n=1 Tax=Portunus trituberculatus TaxID=210409 RepID=A0A5B7EBR1_PORTR|nr:hypothetical protein [Portunus trituberculatus]
MYECMCRQMSLAPSQSIASAFNVGLMKIPTARCHYSFTAALPRVSLIVAVFLCCWDQNFHISFASTNTTRQTNSSRTIPITLDKPSSAEATDLTHGDRRQRQGGNIGEEEFKRVAQVEVRRESETVSIHPVGEEACGGLQNRYISVQSLAKRFSA